MDDGVYNPLLLGTGAPFSQVPRHRLVDLNQASLFINNVELMLINQLVVSSAELPDGLVMLVHEGDVSMAMAVASVVVALEAEEDILALPTASLEVGGPDAIDCITGPDQVSVVTEDVRACLAGTMLLRWRIGVAREGSDKQIARLNGIRGGDGDVEPRRSQVRPGAVLPVRSRGLPKAGCRSQMR